MFNEELGRVNQGLEEVERGVVEVNDATEVLAARMRRIAEDISRLVTELYELERWPEVERVRQGLVTVETHAAIVKSELETTLSGTSNPAAMQAILNAGQLENVQQDTRSSIQAFIGSGHSIIGSLAAQLQSVKSDAEDAGSFMQEARQNDQMGDYLRAIRQALVEYEQDIN